MTEDELNTASIEANDTETNEQWQTRQKIKLLQKERDEKLDSLVYVLPNGKSLQCRMRDEQYLRNGIERMLRLNVLEQLWRMADNTVSFVTASDLQSAIDSGQDQGAEIWAWFMNESEGTGNAV